MPLAFEPAAARGLPERTNAAKGTVEIRLVF